MMKRLICFSIFAAGFFLAGVVLFVSAGQNEDVVSSVFEANIYQPRVSISVPDYVFLGNITLGYSTDEEKMLVVNKGDVAVSVTPALADLNEDIFSYLYFRESSGSYRRIGNFSMTISKPSSQGGNSTKTLYYKLDLREYEGDIDRDLMGHSTRVKFFATAA